MKLFQINGKGFLIGSLFFFGTLFPACGQEQNTTQSQQKPLAAQADTVELDTMAADTIPSKNITIIGVGDMMLGTNYPSKSYLPPNGGKDLLSDVEEILATKLLGVIPECTSVLKASNQGIPVIHDDKSRAGQAYTDAVARLLGDEVEHRFLNPEHKGLFKRLFRRSA